MSSQKLALSLVIPVFNEADNLPELCRRLHQVLHAQGEPYEIIFVNDGSSDRSLEVMKELRTEDENVKIVNLSRNMGHQIALTAGLDHASGQVVITMDADLQHPPELIPRLVEKWREGFEIVYTVLKNTTSSLYYRLLKLMSQVDIQPGAADFRLMGKRSVTALVSMRERKRFLRGLVGWLGFRSTSVPYAAERRFAGSPKYSLRKMMHFALSGILSFSSVPLRAAAYAGLGIALCSGLYTLFAIFARLFTDRATAGWASLVVVTLPRHPRRVCGHDHGGG
jgi:glycosyltransferase involved in cell wall biosynthesis